MGPVNRRSLPGPSVCRLAAAAARVRLSIPSGRLAVAALAMSLLVAHAFAATLEADEASGRQAMQQQNWPQAIADWQQLYLKGDPAAPAQLCWLYFDARQGKFEASRVTDWCRRAAGMNDAGSLYRMGLLYLVGLGVDQNVDQAQALCTAAALRDPRVPAGFCLAAARQEKERAAQEELQLPAATRPAASAAVNEGGSLAQICDRAFNSMPFDAGAAAKWCERASTDGDLEAQYRLGLMNLLGVGGRRDLDIAEADCVRAGTGTKPHSATAYCIAAAAKLRERTASLAISRSTSAIDADPTTGQALPKTGGNPFAVDHVLQQRRTTQTGLSFSCQQVAQWALYEAPDLAILRPSDTLFGRRIVDYGPADFAALEQLADACTRDTAALDADGSLRQQFATFRQSIRPLEARQTQLAQQLRTSRDEAAKINSVDQTYRTSHITMTIRSAQEEACISRVKQSWQASGRDDGHHAVEIGTSSRGSENDRLVAYGIANVVETDSARRAVLSISTYRCTFDQGDGNIAKFQLSPGFTSAH